MQLSRRSLWLRKNYFFAVALRIFFHTGNQYLPLRKLLVGLKTRVCAATAIGNSDIVICRAKCMFCVVKVSLRAESAMPAVACTSHYVWESVTG